MNLRISCKAKCYSLSEDIYHIYGIRKLMTVFTTARIGISYQFVFRSIPVSAETISRTGRVTFT